MFTGLSFLAVGLYPHVLTFSQRTNLVKAIHDILTPKETFERMYGLPFSKRC